MKSESEIVNDVLKDVLRLAKLYKIHLGGENRSSAFISAVKDIEIARKKNSKKKNEKCN